MAELIHTRAGDYLVEWGEVFDLLKQYRRATMTSEMARTTLSADESTIFATIPRLVSLDVPWSTIREQAPARAARDLIEFKARFAGDPEGVRAELRTRETQIGVQTERFRRRNAEIMDRNNKVMEAGLKTIDDHMAIAKFVRDASFATVVFGSSLMTGGASLAALGGGSILTGAATTQDALYEGKVSEQRALTAGLISATTTFGFGMFKLSKAAKLLGKSQDLVVAVLGGVAGTAQGIVGGDSVQDAIADGALSTLSSIGVSKLMDSKMAKSLFRRLPATVKITAPRALRAEGFKTANLAKELLKDSVGRTLEEGSSSLGKALISAEASAPAYAPVAGQAFTPSVGRADRAIRKTP